MMEKYELKRNCMELVPCLSQSGGRLSLFAKINAVGDDNLLLEILTRLATKSLIRFKSVSKYWNFLISQPYFDCRRHQLIVSRNSTPPFAFIFDYSDHKRGSHLSIIYSPTPIDDDDDSESKSESEVFKSGGFSLRFLPCYRRPEIRLPIVVASYNDLLLCHTSHMSPTRRVGVVYTICNPLTMKWVDLPPAPRPKFDLEAFREGIVCDPVSQQVAIVRVPNFNNGFSPMRRFKLHIFTSHTTTNRWIKLRLRCPPGFSSCCLTQPNSVVCDQILFWLCNDYILAYDAFGYNHSPHKDNDNDDNDHHRKNFCFINLPSDYKPHVSNNRLGVCQGKLRLSQWLDSRNESVSEPALSIWELKEDYHNHTGSGTTKWSLEHKFFLKQFASENPKLVQLLKQGKAHMGIVIGFHPHDADIVYLDLEVCVVTCNIRSKTLELVYNISPRPISFVVAMCVYPLVLPWWPTPVPALPPNVAAIPS